MNIVKRFFLFLAGRLGDEYESEHTRFMRQYLAEHPEEIASQREGRAAWWDKTPEDKAPTPSMRHAPRSGGAEHTFVPIPSGGGAEYMFAPDDNAEAKD